MNKKFDYISIETESHIYWAKKLVKELCEEHNIPEISRAEIEICVSELASNLVKFNTINGKIYYRYFNNENKSGVEVISRDEGPGIENVEEAVKDRFSTKGSLGLGLGTVQRLSDEFNIISSKKGTTVRFVKYIPGREKLESKDEIIFSAVSRPHPEERDSGDEYFIKRYNDNIFVAVIDGLGHGFFAKEAAQEAKKYLEYSYKKPIKQIFNEVDEVLRKTRGAVMSIALINKSDKKLTYSGIGNIAVKVYSDNLNIKPININGVLGTHPRKIKIFEYNWGNEFLIILHTDGIKENWALNPNFWYEHPIKIAHYIIDKYWRGNDDATIVVGGLRVE